MTTYESIITDLDLSLANFKASINAKLQTLKLPRSIHSEFLDDTGNYDEERAFQSLLVDALSDVIDVYNILQTEAFTTHMFPMDRQNLILGIYSQLTYLVKNNNIVERVASGSLTTPDIQVNAGTTQTLFTSDRLGTQAKSYLKKANLKKYVYKDVDDTQGYEITSDGLFIKLGTLPDPEGEQNG